MKTNIIRTLLLLSALTARLHAQGSLTPPPGAPGATMKTLTEVEPRTAINATNTPGAPGGNGTDGAVYIINNPGSYYLTGNVTAGASLHGLWVFADDVTIDLNGFNISSSSTGRDGVNIAGNSRITVRNGTITGCRLGLNNNVGADCRYENLTVSGCRDTGIKAGKRCVIQNCTTRVNLGCGIWMDDNSIARSCLAWGNGLTGNLHGIRGWDRCVITDCLSDENYGSGIDAHYNCRISSCSAQKNKISGIAVGTTNTVTDCLCHENTANGISAGWRTHVKSCQTDDNGNAGISLGSGGSATDNNCNGNGYAGIQVNADSCRIERNQARSNEYGISVNNGKSGNFVALNRCVGNTLGNFYVPANNAFAPVIANPGTTFTGATAWSNFSN